VGKTYTGIAVIAKLREQGRARRPVVVVPNTIIWKWYKEIQKALPDYRVVVIGSTRYVGRGGTFASKLDTAEERSLKWRQFQAGEFDVALITFSMLGRTAVRAESFSEWVYETPLVIRKLGLEARALARIVEDDPDEVRKPKITESMMIKEVGEASFQGMSVAERQALADRLATEKQTAKREEIDRLLAVVEGLNNLSERERAIFSVALQRWVAERVEANRDPDPGIYWEDLGCDCLVVDEAQNFKNLWPVGMREGMSMRPSG
jgi:N12 class adenine-specific DNA methylase